MGILGDPKEFCYQTYFRDDNCFTIRKIPLDNTFAIEKKGDVTHAAWFYPYRVLKKFHGYKGIKPCLMLMSYGRDIVLDKFNQLQDGELPEKGKGLVKAMISDIATGVFYKHETSKKRSMADKMVNYVGVVMVVLAIAILITAAT